MVGLLRAPLAWGSADALPLTKTASAAATTIAVILCVA